MGFILSFSRAWSRMSVKAEHGKLHHRSLLFESEAQNERSAVSMAVAAARADH
jgi:hypothetical protein